MPKRQNSIFSQNLAKYDVWIEDTSIACPYFQVTNLPPKFTGGRNSFLLGGSLLLQNGSNILIEILDVNGNTIYNRTIPNYKESNSNLVSVEVYDTTPVGFATIIIMGKAIIGANGEPIPQEWQDKYNVRWSYRILTDYFSENISPLRFQDTPEMIVVENRYNNVYNPRYEFVDINFPVTLSPVTFASRQVGYRLDTIAPVSFSADYINGIFTGSLKVNDTTYNVAMPITSIFNSTMAFTYNYLIGTPENYISSMFLQSASYETLVNQLPATVTSSIKLQYPVLVQPAENPSLTSFANIRIVNLNTVSGEVQKIKLYQKSVTDLGEYKIIGDILVVTPELLTITTNRGIVPYGLLANITDLNETWICGDLVPNTALNSFVYPLSGSSAYYVPPTDEIYPLEKNDNALLSSLHANIEVEDNRFVSPVNENGYFIGNKFTSQLFPTTEYTIEFTARHLQFSGSVILEGNTPNVDIYIVGDSDTLLLSDNPLGQFVGSISSELQARYFETVQFNFTPKLISAGNVYIRFVVSNGFWYFSNISLKPAEALRFSPDEIQIIVPNVDYYNQVVEYKAEFLSANNTTTLLSVTSVPTFFTGSVIDMGLLP
jgi:hypothetical protein